MSQTQELSQPCLLGVSLRAVSAHNCEIRKPRGVISPADMLPAPRINDVLHRVTFAAVWKSPQESGSRAVGIRAQNLSPKGIEALAPHRVIEATGHRAPSVIKKCRRACSAS